MAAKRIDEREIQRYWEIFDTIANHGTHLDGGQAASVLKNSGLSEDQLAKIWDLADVDNDGRLDFEEFCVAMRLIYDMVNGEYGAVPSKLPDWMVPASKAHLVQASSALAGHGEQFEQVEVDDDSSSGLKSGFDWYMSPADAGKYGEIYAANCDARGDVTFAALQPLYDSLDVPDTDVRSAWNLVNPGARSAIGKDACLAFLHLLNNRHEGFRLPRSVPASLRASFERGHVDHTVRRAQDDEPSDRQRGTRHAENTASGRKARFGDAYLARMGLGGGTSYAVRGGTDFGSAESTPDWEEVRLKRQLAELTGKIDKIEARNEDRKRTGGGRADTKPALVKRELEQLLDYKRKELRDLEEGRGAAKAGQDMKALRADVDGVKEQVEGLERHWQSRQQVLEDLRDQVAVEKAR